MKNAVMTFLQHTLAAVVWSAPVALPKDPSSAHHLYHTQDITSLFEEKPEAIKASCSDCKLFNREIFHRGIFHLPMKVSCIIMVSIAACLIHRIFEVNPLRCIKCGGNTSTIPGMPIKKSPKVLPEKCAQKQRDHSPSGGKTDKTVQDMKISPIPTTENP